MVRDKPRKVHRSAEKRCLVSQVVVRSRVANRTQGWLEVGGLRLPCALGRSGAGVAKREGDGVTPLAMMTLRQVWWRADQTRRPRTALPMRAIQPTDGWCDATGDRNYNRHVTLPYPTSHEEMWRQDALYDLVIELGWNDHPRRQGRGSAIFMHVARQGFKPTEGCVALRPRDIGWLLERLSPRTRLKVMR